MAEHKDSDREKWLTKATELVGTVRRDLESKGSWGHFEGWRLDELQGEITDLLRTIRAVDADLAGPVVVLDLERKGELSSRAAYILHHECKVKTLNELVHWQYGDFRRVRECGEKTTREIMRAIEWYLGNRDDP